MVIVIIAPIRIIKTTTAGTDSCPAALAYVTTGTNSSLPASGTYITTIVAVAIRLELRQLHGWLGGLMPWLLTRGGAIATSRVVSRWPVTRLP